MRVLIVEDEPKICAYIKRGLEEQGYAVDTASDGREALELAQRTPFDLMVLDIMLPEVDGITVCEKLRQKEVRTPILMLTARDTVEDRVSGLDAGADDYLIKPFALTELLARLRALCRRDNAAPKSPILAVADLTLDTRSHQVSRSGKPVELTAKEFAVIECLMREAGFVLSRQTIADHVWNCSVFNDSNIIDVYIRNLRRKIDAGHELKLIHTVRGIGYRLSVEDSAKET
ncbi:MAG: response regulator transcription factor [Thermoleophilia bacterium]